MKRYLVIMGIFMGMIYSQCDDYNQSQCIDESSCNWVEDIESGYCGSYNSAASCPNYPICSWSCQGGFYLGECVGWYACTGGYYQQDNSYCEEIEILECSEMNQSECNNDESCNWVEDIEYGSCNANSTSQCNSDQNCEWINNISYASCSSLGTSNSSFCDAQPQCSYSWLTYTCGGGTYEIDNSYCSGGSYEVDASYCEEIIFEQGDLNGDYSVNVLDVIILVDIIINDTAWNYEFDINGDDTLNVLDVILVVDIIVGN